MQKKRAAVAAAAARAAAAKHAAMMLLAPADEYFGPLKQSILGIRNTLRDLGLRYDVNHDIGPQTVASAGLTERAIRDWEKKYPKDHGIAVQLFSLQRLYSKVLTEEARAKARVTANWLIARYPGSPQAREMRTLLVSETLPPLASPSPVASPSPEAAASTTSSPLPVATPLRAP